MTKQVFETHCIKCGKTTEIEFTEEQLEYLHRMNFLDSVLFNVLHSKKCKSPSLICRKD